MGRKEKDNTEIVMKVYDYIVKRQGKDITPTIREICTDLNIQSTSTAHKYLNILCDMGLIEKQDSRNRAIKIVNSESCAVPILGTVAAGAPISAIQSVEGYVSFSNYRGDPSQLFALKVKGESMINAAILDGDFVIVKKQSTANNGAIVVAMIEDEATVKTFYKENNHFRLQPENDTMEAIIVDEVTVLGIVIGVSRFYN